MLIVQFNFMQIIVSNDRSLDLEDKGFVMEDDLRKLLTGKIGITEDDIEDMIREYNCSDLIPRTTLAFRSRGYSSVTFQPQCDAVAFFHP